MQINGKLSGIMDKLLLAVNKSRSAETANVDFVTRVTEPECKTVFGHEFATAVAFGGMVRRATTDADGKPDGGEVYVHLTKQPQPSGKLTIQMHKIRMLGRTLDKIQPALSVSPVQGEAKVDVTVKVPIDLGVDIEFDSKVIAAIKQHTTIAIEFEPKQGVLDFATAKAAQDAEPEEAETGKLALLPDPPPPRPEAH